MCCVVHDQTIEKTLWPVFQLHFPLLLLWLSHTDDLISVVFFFLQKLKHITPDHKWCNTSVNVATVLYRNDLWFQTSQVQNEKKKQRGKGRSSVLQISWGKSGFCWLFVIECKSFQAALKSSCSHTWLVWWAESQSKPHVTREPNPQPEVKSNWRG